MNKKISLVVIVFIVLFFIIVFIYWYPTDKESIDSLVLNYFSKNRNNSDIVCKGSKENVIYYLIDTENGQKYVVWRKSFLNSKYKMIQSKDVTIQDEAFLARDYLKNHIIRIEENGLEYISSEWRYEVFSFISVIVLIILSVYMSKLIKKRVV